ncbi:glycosyltransferase family protein [Bacillus massilinigeriensis]|uniref:glycosyltransferase n=1 Tax=Bacillus mediterraneensis TaxID=1805474 RepID=UPI0008F8981C|nr:glycosyltransferase [Bacillus mediterraneensis]
MEGITIVYPPAIDYKFMYQRPQQMMKVLAELGANVLFINPETFFRQDKDIELPFPSLPNFKVLKKNVDLSPFLKGKVVLWCAVNQGKEINRLKPDLTIYDSCDLPSDEFSVWKDLIPEMEEKSDIIFATSQPIYKFHRRKGKDVLLLPNGADYDHFKVAEAPMGDRPKDLPVTEGKPLIGYYGAIYSWLDVEVIKKIASWYPVVLIGSKTIDIHHPNVTILDMKFYEDLPQYLSWFDVAIIPFKMTQMIKATHPIKFFEYLSAGKPVVSAPLPELEKYKHLCFFADENNVLQRIQAAIETNSPEKIHERQKAARENSWLDRGKEALQIIKYKLCENTVY